MAHDVVITGGTVVDGTGAEPRRADVAIDGSRIVAVGDVDGTARRTIDASGRYVTPGFVDVHTHLDAQLSWDPIGSSSCWHGVTSVVLGNCGVTFAPCRADDREYLAGLMESVEDIPAACILDGLSWDWESYGEYLDTLDGLSLGVNAGGMVGHCAVRQWAMGERGLDPEPATADDIAAMADLVDEAIGAGALGFSTSRTLLHRVPDGRPVPGTWAQPDELFAIAEVLGRRGRGTFEVAPRLGERDDDTLEGTRAEVAWMGEVNRRTGRPVTFAMAHSFARPELYRRILEFVDEEAARGGVLRPQTTARGIGLLFGISHRTLFDGCPSWRALRDLPLAGRLAALDDAGRRDALIAEADAQPPGLDPNLVFVLGTDGDARYDYSPADSLAARAAAAGESIAATFVRLSRESRGRALFNYPFLNQEMGAVAEMLHHPSTMIGLADSGAHVGMIMDASLPTFFLAHWVRDRAEFTIAEGVRRLTSDTAGVFGIAERGVLEPGRFADVNVFDLDALALPMPEFVYDFPGGAGRFVQRGRGYDATLVNGEVTVEAGESTGSLPGTLLRSRAGKA